MQPCDGACSAQRPASLRKDSTHDAVLHGCCLGCHARIPAIPARRRQKCSFSSSNDLSHASPQLRSWGISPWSSRAATRARRRASPPPEATRLLRSDRLVINTEVCERVYDGHHLPTEFGEAILNAGWILAIVVAKDQPIVLHLAQAVGKHLLGDALKVAAQLVEALGPLTQITDDKQLPLAADKRHRCRDRTLW